MIKSDYITYLNRKDLYWDYPTGIHHPTTSSIMTHLPTCSRKFDAIWNRKEKFALKSGTIMYLAHVVYYQKRNEI